MNIRMEGISRGRIFSRTT